jgi:hypothetical protein
MNKFLAIAILVSLSMGVLGGAFETDTTGDVANNLYTLSGACFYIFGGWLSIRVLLGKNK